MAISASNAALTRAKETIGGDIYIEQTGEGTNATSEIKMKSGESFQGLAYTMQTEGTNLINDLDTIFKSFTGNTKEAVMEKIGTVANPGAPEEGKLAYVLTSVLPEMVKQIAVIIEVNRSLIEQYDSGLAKALRESGQNK